MEEAETTAEKEIQISIEQAKKILADEDKRIVEEAAKEFNILIEEWSKKHNCRLQISGQFQGEILETKITIIKNQ